MQAADVMKSPVITVNKNATLADVARLLEQHRISGLPVVDDDDRLVGIISEHDLLRESQRLQVKRGLDTLGWVSPHTSVEDVARFTRGLCTIGEITVEQAMTRNPITVEENTSLEKIALSMARRRINRVPVVKAGRVVGIITRADLVWAMSNLCELKPGIFG